MLIFSLHRMAQNARLSRIATKDDESTFCWKIFTGKVYRQREVGTYRDILCKSIEQTIKTRNSKLNNFHNFLFISLPFSRSLRLGLYDWQQ